MKYAITGHTAGIGRALFTYPELDVQGYSRTNGYNIDSKADRDRIIADVNNADIFINNAYSGSSQTNMLYELFDVWQDRQKLIVNIGSDTTCGIKNSAQIYTAHKAALHKASEQLSHLNKPCKVINIRFGWVGTERILKRHNPNEYILVEDAAKYIIDQITWAGKYRITDTLIRP